MLGLYRLATSAAAPALRAYLKRRARRGKEDPARLGERLGHAGLPRPPGTVVWLHAVSVGEATSVLALIERLSEIHPTFSFLVTTGTVTSAAVMAERLPANAVHQYVPVDLPAAVKRFLDHWQPDFAIWVESELWPNLLGGVAEARIPAILINARMSARSFGRWRRFPGTAARLLAAFSVCLAQDETTAKRLARLGAAHVALGGNLKHAAPPLPVDEAALARLRAETATRPVWLAASTHAGEEAAAAAAHRHGARRAAGLLTIIVPRHPDRAASIADDLLAQGFAVQRRSDEKPVGAQTEIYLADTIGELGLFYRVVEIAFVGGSLVAHGGQNALEAVKLDCAVLLGPHTENFAAIARELVDMGAAERVADAAALAERVDALLHDETARGRMIEAGRAASRRGEEILARTVEAVEAVMANGKDNERARA